MPIEIRELIIRTTITTDGSPVKRHPELVRQYNEKDMVDRCVEKVIRMLNKKIER